MVYFTILHRCCYRHKFLTSLDCAGTVRDPIHYMDNFILFTKCFIQFQSKWVKDQKLGGIMFWSVDNDDFRGACHDKPFPLIEAAKLAYYTGKLPSGTKVSSTSTSRFSVPKSKSSSSSRNRYSTLQRYTTTDSPSTEKPRRKKNKNRRRSDRNRRRKNKTTETQYTTTTPVPVTFNPLSTPEPPTTPNPGAAFECKDEGFFPNPKECKKYFWCLDAPGLGLVAHRFTCPAGLFFNVLTDSCDYARNVPCKPGETVTTTTTTTTTTQRPTTSRTPITTKKPDSEEYDDEEYEDSDEYYDEEEEEEKTTPKPITRRKYTDIRGGNRGSSRTTTTTSTTTPSSAFSNSRRKNSGSSEESDKEDQELDDIKKLLKLIRKLGGVEELEKYLDANPSIAAQLKDEDYVSFFSFKNEVQQINTFFFQTSLKIR